MSAFVGMLHKGPNPLPGWATAVERLASRSAPCEATAELEGLRAAYRGRDRSGYHVSGQDVVLLDGEVDNAAALASEAGLRLEPSGTPAAAARMLVQALGPAVLPRLEGSFALALVELGNRRVHLVRDRFGRRPLSFASVGSGWAWASEIKCLVPLLPSRALDPEALPEIYHYRWLVGETTPVAGIRHVLPGTRVTLELGGVAAARPYWTLSFEPDPEPADPREWEDRIDGALGRCLRRLAGRHARAACLLSGGVDSSLIAAKAIEAGFRRCLAVTPRFPGHDNPELEPAARVARHLGLEHVVVDVEDGAVDAELPSLVWRLEEPPRHYHAFALNALFARMAPEVDVVLDGNAGDALFGTREMIELQRQAWVDWCPAVLRRSVARCLPFRPHGRLAKLRTHLLADQWSLPFWSDAVVYSRPPSDVAPGLPADPRPNAGLYRALSARALGPIEHFQRLHVYTRNRSHTEKNDRLAAPYGLTVIAPFLEPEIVAVAAKVPTGLKVQGKVIKPLLKRLGSRYFPAEWMYAPKRGFPVPIREWLSGPLRPWLRLLSEERTAARGLFATKVLAGLDPSGDFQLLWTSLCLEIFIRQFLEDDATLIPAISAAEAAPRTYRLA